MLVGELMGSRRLLILAGSALFLVALIIRSLTLIGDSQSVPDRLSANSADTASNAQPPALTGSASGLETPSPAPAVLPIDENSGEVKAALPLFRPVNKEYLRGAQPYASGVNVLVRLGVRTIVDLRSKYDRTPGLADEADRAGLGYYWLPLSVWDPPTDAQTAEFLAVVTNPSRGPVFVFCTDGVNRTGEMTAIYRIIHGGWSVEEALKEMDDAGFSPYYYSLRNYVWSYTRAHKPRRGDTGRR